MYIAKVLMLVCFICPNLMAAQVKGIRFIEASQKDNIKIGSVSSGAMANVDEVASQIKIGKCEVKREEETAAQSNYCDFLFGEHGKIFTSYADFENLTATSLTLQQVTAKDQIVIKLNGNLVYSSTGEPNFTLTNDRFREVITDEAFDYYYGILVNKKVVPVQTNKMLSLKPGLNLTNYLKKGTNHVEIQVAVGYRGGYQVNFGFGAPSKKEKYPCQDSNRYCSQGRERRIVEGIYETRDCWQYSHTKTCNYPSKNDCWQYAACILIADKECLLKDYYGACVNVLREYSCQSIDETYEIQRPKFKEVNPDTNRPGITKCKGVPCFDGLCGQTHFDKDEDMLPTVSKLTAVATAKGKDINNISLFAGQGLHCSNKLASYSNCCKIKGFGRNKNNGWGHKIGAKCNSQEQQLADMRQQNLCVYVGKTRSTTLGVKSVDKHHFCCFGNILDKIIQTQGRGQLGMNFGSGGNPDCRGLTISELLRIDFNKIDYSDFYPVIKNKIKIPKTEDIMNRVNRGMPATGSSNGITPNVKTGKADENYN
jgi:conjugal transfer mating pair stabilization protein TraN